MRRDQVMTRLCMELTPSRHPQSTGPATEKRKQIADDTAQDLQHHHALRVVDPSPVVLAESDARNDRKMGPVAVVLDCQRFIKSWATDHMLPLCRMEPGFSPAAA